MADLVQNKTGRAVERLQLLMRVFGCICIVAFFPFVMPVEWMDWCHRQLDLGGFPADKPGLSSPKYLRSLWTIRSFCINFGNGRHQISKANPVSYRRLIFYRDDRDFSSLSMRNANLLGFDRLPQYPHHLPAEVFLL